EGREHGPNALRLSRTALSFVAKADHAPRTQAVFVRAERGGAVRWTAKADAPWVQLPRPQGQSPGRVSVRVDPSGLRPGTHRSRVTVTSAEKNAAATLDITLTVAAQSAAAVASG